MLPFTKRPGRGDDDVVTKEDLVKDAAASSAPKARKPAASITDEEEKTTLMPTKALGNSGVIAALGSRPQIRPAAGAPPPARSSARKIEIDDEDGRTQVRGAPKIVKRAKTQIGLGGGGAQAQSQPDTHSKEQPIAKPASKAPVDHVDRGLPTTVSPAAVIKASLDNARAAREARDAGAKKGDSLRPAPPINLLEELAADLHPANAPEKTAVLASPPSQPPPHAAPQQQFSPMAFAATSHINAPPSQAVRHAPPSAAGPASVPPPSSANPNASGSYPYAGAPSGAMSVPGVAISQSMPAHFMVAQAPVSDARMDPPGTAVTSRSKAKGRSASSWVMALMCCGVFVGVGAFAAMQKNQSVVTTTAAFVDPSQVGRAPAAQPAVPVAQPNVVIAPVQAPAPVAQPVAVTPSVVQPAVAQPGPQAGQPVVVQPAVAQVAAPVAQPAVAQPAQPAVAQPVVAQPVAAQPTPVAAQPVAVAAPAAPAKTVKVHHAAPPPPAPVEKVEKVEKKAPEKKVAAADEDAPKKGAGKKGGAPAAAKGDATDEETKKALEALQKAQLESSSSFGEK